MTRVNPARVYFASFGSADFVHLRCVHTAKALFRASLELCRSCSSKILVWCLFDAYSKLIIRSQIAEYTQPNPYLVLISRLFEAYVCQCLYFEPHCCIYAAKSLCDAYSRLILANVCFQSQIDACMVKYMQQNPPMFVFAAKLHQNPYLVLI